MSIESDMTLLYLAARVDPTLRAACTRVDEELRALRESHDALAAQLDICVDAWLALRDMANGPVYQDMYVAADHILSTVADFVIERRAALAKAGVAG